MNKTSILLTLVISLLLSVGCSRNNDSSNTASDKPQDGWFSKMKSTLLSSDGVMSKSLEEDTPRFLIPFNPPKECKTSSREIWNFSTLMTGVRLCRDIALPADDNSGSQGGCDIKLLDHKATNYQEYPAIASFDGKIYSYIMNAGSIKERELKVSKLEGTVLSLLKFNNQKTHLSEEQCNFIFSNGGHIHSNKFIYNQDFLKSCFPDIGTKFKKLGAKCQQKLREDVVLVLNKILSDFNQYMITSTAANGENTVISKQQLHDYFELTILWSRTVNANLSNHFSTAEENKTFIEATQAKLQDHSNIFWQRYMLEKKQDLATTTVQKFSDQYYLNRSEILKTLFSIENVPASIMISHLGEILIPLYERLEYLAGLQDLLCQLGGCPKNKGELLQEEILLSLKLISSIANKNEYLSALNQARTVRSFNSKLFEMFTVIGENIDKINVAIADMNKTNYLSVTGVTAPSNLSSDDSVNLLYKGDLARYQDYSLLFLRALRGSQNIITSFNSKGITRDGGKKILNYAFDERNINSIKTYSKELLDKLSRDSAGRDIDYQRKELAQAILQQENNKQFKEQLNNEIERENLDLKNLLKDLNGIRKTISEDTARIGNLVNGLDDFSGINVDKWAQLFNTSGKVAIKTSSFTIVPPRESDSSNDNSTYIGVEGKSVLAKLVDQVPKGDTSFEGHLISIRVNGSWSPICALNRSEKYKSVASKKPMIGPEGFNFFESNGDSNSTTASDVEIKNKSDITNDVIGNTTRTTGHNQETITNKLISSEQRGNASFAIGLRMADTPFPDMPAGALLLVAQTQSAEKKTIRDVIIVEREGSYITTSNTNYYLVVNDCYQQGSTISGGLTVTITKAIPLTEIAKDFVSAIIDTLKKVDEKGRDAVLMGYSSGTELEKLRAEALLSFQMKGDLYNLFQYRFLNDFFQSWLNIQLALVERKVNEDKLIKLIETKRLKIKHLLIERDGVDTQSKYINATKLWVLENVDLSILGRRLKDTIEFANNIYLPMLNFSYPNLQIDINELKLSSKDINVDTDAKDIRRYLQILFDYFDSKIKPLDITKVRNSYKTVFVSFPYPRSKLSELPSELFDPRVVKNQLNVGIERSASLWNQIPEREMDDNESGTLSTFQVFPKDIYFHRPRSGRLTCDSVYPVVESIGLYFVVDSDNVKSLNSAIAHQPFTLEVKSSLNYLMETGIDSFDLAPSGWQKPQIKVLFGSNDTMLPDIENMFVTDAGSSFGSYSGQGLSPFSTFAFDFLSLFNTDPTILKTFLNKSITDIRVVFKVRYNMSTQRMTWIEGCKPGGQ
ncbi:MAG: hypothetical protein HQK49_13245 [Oligoflexia bacterium]|nr:hypothetical protein [Oligoflexia bacterium]